MCDTYTKRENTLNSSVSKQFIKVTSLEWQWLKKARVYLFFNVFLIHRSTHTRRMRVIDLYLNHSFLRVGIEPNCRVYAHAITPNRYSNKYKCINKY